MSLTESQRKIIQRVVRKKQEYTTERTIEYLQKLEIKQKLLKNILEIAIKISCDYKLTMEQVCKIIKETIKEELD